MCICGQALQIYNKLKSKRRKHVLRESKMRRLSTILETTLLFSIDNDVYTIHVENDEDENQHRSREDRACDFYVPMSLLVM